MDGFHVKDGLFFNRLKDGSVRIVKTKDSSNGSPIELDITIDSDSWCSVISSVSKLGEEYGRFFLAKEFHNVDKKHPDYI